MGYHYKVTPVFDQPLDDTNPVSKVEIPDGTVRTFPDDICSWNHSEDGKTLTLCWDSEFGISENKDLEIKVKYPGGTAPSSPSSTWDECECPVVVD